MVEFVLQDSAKELVCFLFKLFSINILSSDTHLAGSSDLGGDSGHRKAALFGADRSAELKQLGININLRLIHLARRSSYEELEIQSYLSCCQADALGLIHKVNHPHGERFEALIKNLDPLASDL